MSRREDFTLGGLASLVRLGKRGPYIGASNTEISFNDNANTSIPISIGEPTTNNHAATKNYVDNALSSIAPKDSSFKTSVKGIWPNNITNFSTFGGGITSSLDGNVRLQAGDRILVINQTDKTQNGIYELRNTVPKCVRTSDANTSEKLVNAFVYVSEGLQAGKRFYLTTFNDSNTLGSDDVIFNEYGSGSVNTGAGIESNNNTISLSTNTLPTLSGSLDVNNDTLAIYDASTNSHVKVKVSDIKGSSTFSTDEGIQLTNNIVSLSTDTLPLTTKANIDIANDTFPIYDASTDSHKKVSISDIVADTVLPNISDTNTYGETNITVNKDTFTYTADGTEVMRFVSNRGNDTQLILESNNTKPSIISIGSNTTTNGDWIGYITNGTTNTGAIAGFRNGYSTSTYKPTSGPFYNSLNNRFSVSSKHDNIVYDEVFSVDADHAQLYSGLLLNGKDSAVNNKKIGISFDNNAFKYIKDDEDLLDVRDIVGTTGMFIQTPKTNPPFISLVPNTTPTDGNWFGYITEKPSLNYNVSSTTIGHKFGLKRVNRGSSMTAFSIEHPSNQWNFETNRLGMYHSTLKLFNDSATSENSLSLDPDDFTIKSQNKNMILHRMFFSSFDFAGRSITNEAKLGLHSNARSNLGNTLGKFEVSINTSDVTPDDSTAGIGKTTWGSIGIGAPTGLNTTSNGRTFFEFMGRKGVSNSIYSYYKYLRLEIDQMKFYNFGENKLFFDSNSEVYISGNGYNAAYIKISPDNYEHIYIQKNNLSIQTNPNSISSNDVPRLSLVRNKRYSNNNTLIGEVQFKGPESTTSDVGFNPVGGMQLRIIDSLSSARYSRIEMHTKIGNSTFYSFVFQKRQFLSRFNGTKTSPAYGFETNSNAGMYFDAVKQGVTLSSSSSTGGITSGVHNVILHSNTDLYMDKNAIVFESSGGPTVDQSSTSNIDHIWFNPSDGSLNVVNNGSYKSAGNGKIVAAATAANHADLAEKYEADDSYEAGTVVVIGGSKEVTSSTKEHDRSVVGIISTEPAFMMNNKPEHKDWPYVALSGRVPCKVYGDIKRGDLLVSGLNGHATNHEDPKTGALIGIAMEDYQGESGIIEVVVKSG